MHTYLLDSLVIVIALVTLNYIMLKKSNYSKSFGVISILYSIFQVILCNIYYVSLINSSEYYIKLYSELTLNLNKIFILVTVVELIVLLILKSKINFKLHKIITIVLYISTTIFLILFKGMIISKTIVDISLFAWVLIINYINLINIPILFSKK